MKTFSTLLKIVLIVFCLFLNVWNVCAEEVNGKIAVIPFENLMGDASINGLSAGIASEIMTKLGAVPEITLVERMQLKKALEEQSFQLAGYVDPKTAVNIGEIAGAKVVVVGEYQKIGNQLKITARFVDVETAEVIKGKTAEVEGSYDPDVFKLENEIAFQIVRALGGATDVAKETKVKKEIEAKVTTSSISAFEWFGKGEEASNSGLYDKAIEYYTKAIEMDGNYALAYSVRGVAYSMNNLPDEAIKDCTRAIVLDPQNKSAYLTRGQAYDQKGLFDEAIKDSTKVIELDPENADFYFVRGIDYFLNGQKDKAKKDFIKAADLGSEEARKGLKEWLGIDY